MDKVKIKMNSTDRTDIAAHLKPVISFIKSMGNVPVNEDQFAFDENGFGSYLFKDSIDPYRLLDIFVFPETILISNKGIIIDIENFLEISGGLNDKI